MNIHAERVNVDHNFQGRAQATGLLLDLHLSKLHIITNSNNGERDPRGDGNAMKADPRASEDLFHSIHGSM
jgi:hypothetical protein